MHLRHCSNIENIFEHANKSALTIFDKHNFAIYYEKVLHNLKQTKEKKNYILFFKCKRRSW